LPNDIAHKPGNVDRINSSALLEVLYQPFFGLIVDKNIIAADAGFT
jgi:hypothetical protein